MSNHIKTLLIAMLAALLVACGGGSSSDPAEQQFGGMTILIGDGPLDTVDQVNIDIGRILLIGGDGGQVILTEDAMPDEPGTMPGDETINLLELRNVTTLLLDADGIPAGNYTKVRLYINTLEIVEDLDEEIRQDAQLPANGKIDLLVQGGFEISPGEDLVVEIDVDLERSVHVVATGSSAYRFRPVVFIEKVDIRLSQLFGTVQGEVTADSFNLCLGDRCNCSADENDCVRVDARNALTLPELGDTDLTLSEPNPVHVFGLFDVREMSSDLPLVRAEVVVKGDVDTIAKIDGGVALADTGDISSIGGTDISPVTGALILDRHANLIVAAAGDDAESWAQVDPVMDLPVPFPSFMTLVTPAVDEDAVEGDLISVEGDLLTLATDELEEVCVVVDEETEIQLVEGFNNDSTTGPMPLTDLLTLDPQMETIEVVAFGSFDGECLNADVLVIETD